MEFTESKVNEQQKGYRISEQDLCSQINSGEICREGQKAVCCFHGPGIGI